MLRFSIAVNHLLKWLKSAKTEIDNPNNRKKNNWQPKAIGSAKQAFDVSKTDKQATLLAEKSRKLLC